MKLLLTNDDGFGAEGISILAEALSKEHEVCIVAPERDNSGASCSLTIFSPLKLVRHSGCEFSLDGSPVDCVMSALDGGYIPWLPDAVISGINRGANLGTDIIYSGTCGAARQAAIAGYPSVALSIDGFAGGKAAEDFHFETLAEFTLKNLNGLIRLCGSRLDYSKGSGRRFFVNVNAPASEKYSGCKFAGCCVRRYSDNIKVWSNEVGEMVSSCIGGNVLCPDEEESSDFSIVGENCVAISRIYAEPCFAEPHGSPNFTL